MLTQGNKLAFVFLLCLSGQGLTSIFFNLLCVLLLAG
jgi:hypothetical protein